MIFTVSQCLNRRDRDRIPRVHAHRVDIFDRANNDAIVFVIADNFKFVFLPSKCALVDEHLTNHAGGKSATNDVLEFFHVVCDATTAAAKCERGTNDRWQADLFQKYTRVFDVCDGLRMRLMQSKPTNDFAKRFAIFRAANRFA